MYQFADRVNRIQGDGVKEVLKMLADPSIISLGGGAPAKEGFDIAAVNQISSEILATRGLDVLQYGQTSGYQPLREAYIKHLLAPKGIEAKLENVAIFTGSTQAIYHALDVFVNEGDTVLVENPTYMGTLNALQKFDAHLVAVNMDEGGLDVEDLEAKVKAHRPKALYTVPTFQNPTGRTLEAKRRERIAELAGEYNFIVLEDDPYGELRFKGEMVPPIKAFDKTGHVILMNSFSKIVSPGMRVGTAVADPIIIEKMETVKQCGDMHTAFLTQAICAEFLSRGLLPNHLAKIRSFYKERAQALLDGLDTYFPADCEHTLPEGGMFVWAKLPKKMDTLALLKKAVAECKVSFVPGIYFCLDPKDGVDCMRLNFSGATPENLSIATERLGKLIQKELAK